MEYKIIFQVINGKEIKDFEFLLDLLNYCKDHYYKDFEVLEVSNGYDTIRYYITIL